MDLIMAGGITVSRAREDIRRSGKLLIGEGGGLAGKLLPTGGRFTFPQSNPTTAFGLMGRN